MADEFSRSVQSGLKLSKRIYYGKDSSVSAPVPAVMEKSPSFSETLLPTGPMAYAVITEPSIVDNPDIPSYQPYVHGRCEPPAMIPLHMHGIAMEVEVYLDTAFVTVCGTWRVHCVTASKSCVCRIAIPMGEQGSILGVEIDGTRRSYHTQLVTMEDTKDTGKVDSSKDGYLLNRQIYTLQVFEVTGGSYLSIKVRWSKKLLYKDGQFCLSVPFIFPGHVVPVGKKLSKREKIMLNVNSGTAKEVLCKTTSHPLKELRRQVGILGLLYEAEVPIWSTNDFTFSYSVRSSDIFGGLLLHSPSLHDFDQREMFCFYLFAGNNNSKEVFRREVVFVVDISASMGGLPFENAKDAVLAALYELNPVDYFNLIAFNGNTMIFSSSMVLATKDAIQNATQWVSINCIAEGGTNMSLPLNQAMEMLTRTGDSIPFIFLITDGAVEDERDICSAMKGRLATAGPSCPRICTFGIGSFCNHYFLQMLAQIGRGCYDAAFDVDSINIGIQRLFHHASSVILANMTVDALEHLDSLELYPLRLPDLLSGSPLVASGRYEGDFPDAVKASGTLADSSNFVVDIKVQKAKSMPIDKVLARRQIDMLTAHAWWLESKQLEEKVVKMSTQTGVPSEYTRLILVQTDKVKQASSSVPVQEKMADLNEKKIIMLRNLGVGFGNLIATAENLPPRTEEAKIHEASETMMIKAASNYCSRLLDCCCCMCFIQACSLVNDRCAVALTQLCAALACFGCLNCCCELCFSCD